MSCNKNYILQSNKGGLKIGWMIVFVLFALNLWTFISKYNTFGVSGNAIGSAYAAPPVLTTDMIIFIAQWAILIILVIFLYLRHARRVRMEHTKINLSQYEKLKNVRGGTDIDVLFSVLQENKEIGLSTVESLFKVNSEKALKWCKVLEEHNLASIYYPAFSEPIIRKIE